MELNNWRKQIKPITPRTLPGVVHTAGLEPCMVRTARSLKQLHRIRPGSYSFHPQEPDKNNFYADLERITLERISAITKFVRPDSALSHTSAAALWGLPMSPTSMLPHITSQSTSNSTPKNLIIHRTSLPAEHVTSINGLRVTTIERTIVDCLRLLPPAQGLIFADSALTIGLNRELAIHINQELPSARFRQRAHDLLEFAALGAESPQESILRFHLGSVGWPGLETQVPVLTPIGWSYLDVGLLREKVGFEYDGMDKYSGDALRQEKIREHSLRNEGWHIERFIASDLRDPQLLHARLRTIAHDRGVKMEQTALMQHAKFDLVASYRTRPRR